MKPDMRPSNLAARRQPHRPRSALISLSAPHQTPFLFIDRRQTICEVNQLIAIFNSRATRIALTNSHNEMSIFFGVAAIKRPLRSFFVLPAESAEYLYSCLIIMRTILAPPTNGSRKNNLTLNKLASWINKKLFTEGDRRTRQLT